MFAPVILNEEKTKEVFGYSPFELEVGSHKKVVVECTNCHRVIYREFRNQNAKHQCPVVEGGRKRCFRCGEWKDTSLFHKNPRLSGGVAKMCRQCHNAHPSVQRNESNRKIRMRYAIENGDIEFYITRRFNAFKSVAKQKGVFFDLDVEYLLELWKKQEGLCYYTRMPMSNSLKQVGFQAWDAPSLDRKEPHLGYTKNNVVWCSFGVNSFKQSLSEQQFSQLLKQIKWWNQ